MADLSGKLDGVDIADNALGVVGKVALAAGRTALFAMPVFQIPIIGWILQVIAGVVLASFEALVIRELQKTTNAMLIFVSEEENAKNASISAAALAEAQTDPSATSLQKLKALDDFQEKYARLIGFRISTDSLG